MGRMIFVMGNSRSGTTMMGRVLGGHRSVFTFNELHFFEQLWDPVVDPRQIGRKAAIGLTARLLTIQRDGYYTQNDPAGYTQEAARIVGAMHDPITPPAVFTAFIRYECAKHGKTTGCDQTPRNLYYLDELLQLYPDARFVVMVRDPRDVLLSQKNRWKRRRLGAKDTPWWTALRTWAGYHPITIGLLWRSGVAAGERFADDPRVCELRFEDLLADPQAELKKICNTVGLDYDPGMLDVPRVGSSHGQDRPDERGLDPAAAGRWKQGGLTRAELAVCQRIAGEHMTRHGYVTGPVGAPLLALARCRVTWVFKSVLALALNLRRIRSLRESLRRRLGR
jgi:omega-hydroxy-beta-dihydromenaquinone-9 sulfotransferase